MLMTQQETSELGLDVSSLWGTGGTLNSWGDLQDAYRLSTLVVNVKCGDAWDKY